MALVSANFNGYPPPRDRSCRSKRFYRNLFAALTACSEIYHNFGDSLWPYRCLYCKGYHTGHVPRQVLVLIEGLVGDV